MWKNYLNLPRPVYTLCLGSFINRAGTLVIIFLALYVQRELGLGVAVATWTLSAFGFGALIASLIGGHLADRIGRRTVMAIALFGGAGILLLFSSLRSPLAIVAAAFSFALLSEMYRPAASAMIADLVEPARRNHAFGLMYFSINLGFSVAPVVGGILATYSYRWLFWGDALTASIYGGLILVAIRETLPSRTKEGTTVRAGREGNGVAPESIPISKAFARVLSDRAFMIFVGATFLTAMIFMQYLSTLPVYLMRYGIGEGTYGRLIAVNGIMIVALQLPLTAFFSRFHRGTIVALGAVVTGIGFGLTGVVTQTPLFALTIAFWTMGELLQAPFLPAVISDMAPKDLRGRYMGVFSTSFSGALMIGAPLGGFVLERFGAAYVWGGCCALGVLAEILFLTIHKQMGVK